MLRYNISNKKCEELEGACCVVGESQYTEQGRVSESKEMMFERGDGELSRA